MVSSGSPPSRLRLPWATRTKPTMVRSSDDFPAPLRPVIAKTSPDPTAKLTPANTSRPPRWQAKLTAESRIRRPPGPRQPGKYRLFALDLLHRRKRPYKPLVARGLLIGSVASIRFLFSPVRGAGKAAGHGDRSGNP